MKFKKQIFGFMDMLRFKNMVPLRRKKLQEGSSKPLPTSYRVNEMAKALHPGYMEVELVNIKKLTNTINEYTFKRIDSNKFPFFRAGQYVSLQAKFDNEIVSRPYSIVSSPRDALKNTLVLAIEKAGFFSHYLHENAKIGDHFMMCEPSGEFHYETLRDHKHIICIAGGSGITPFMSMAKSQLEKDEDYEMILFYGAKTVNDLAYKQELDEFAKKGIKVVYVLSNEKVDGYEHGFINKELIEKYIDIKSSTIFMCGPSAMYDFLLKEFKPLNLPIKAIHKDASCCGDLEISNAKTYKLTVRVRDEKYVIDANENETLLVAMERAGINVPNKCRAGGCGFCHSKLINGKFKVAANRDGRREADKKFNFIHPCVTYPCSDMEIEVPVAY